METSSIGAKAYKISEYKAYKIKTIKYKNVLIKALMWLIRAHIHIMGV